LAAIIAQLASSESLAQFYGFGSDRTKNTMLYSRAGGATIGISELTRAAQLPSQAAKNRRSAGPAASRLDRRELRARVTSAAVRSCRCVLVAAAAAPLLGAGA